MQAAASAMAAIVASVAAFLGGGSHHEYATALMPAALRTSAPRLAQDPIQLAAVLAQAQRTIDNPASSAAQLRTAGRAQQRATVVLAQGPVNKQHAAVGRLAGAAAASLRANVTAAAALARLERPRRSLPPWRIAVPPPPAVLLGFFKAAQSRYGVPWEYLAAIELIESDFGRVIGLSTAGAEGPMQFMPATWAEYGTGNVHNQRDAIFAAARYLVANGAPVEMSRAIYHYNLSRDYVAAVRAYAGRMRADPRAFYGYYYWQVIFARVSGLVILPAGFPHVPAVPFK